MSTLQDNQASWTNLAEQQLDSKYEKCRNITEEIYKRINITFQIKKLETGDQSDISDNSEQIDSNELSNETDLFACDKSDISSTDAEKTAVIPSLPAFVNINNNNNEERNKPQINKPRKRFRKRVKKRPPNRKRSDSEGSSDEAPLSRSVVVSSPDLKAKPNIDKKVFKKSSINSLTLKELLKPTKVPTVVLEKIQAIDIEAVKRTEATKKNTTKSLTVIDSAEFKAVAINKSTDNVISIGKEVGSVPVINNEKERKNIEAHIDHEKVLSMTDTDKKTSGKDVKITDWKGCSLCSLSFRGERGLRRHMSMSHILE